MEPEWHQDINTKGIQPKHIPHFETAGQQMDWEQRKLAAKLVITNWGGVLLGVCFLIGLMFVPQAFEQRKSGFGQMPETERSETFRDRILLRAHSIKKESSVPGQLFMTSKARSGFVFLTIEITVANRSEEKFAFNPLAFALSTGDGTIYRTAFNTHHHPEGLRNKKIKAGKEVRGLIIFQIPNQVSLSTLQLLGSGNVIATVKL